MKRLSALLSVFLCILFLIFSLSSCSPERNDNQDDSSGTESDPYDDAVVLLSCLDLNDDILRIDALGDRKIAVVTGSRVYSSDIGESSTPKELFIVDIGQDTIIAQMDLRSLKWELSDPIMMRENGEIVYVDYDQYRLALRSPSLKPLGEVILPENTVPFSFGLNREQDLVYFLKEDYQIENHDVISLEILTSISFEGEETVIYPVRGGFTIYDPKSNRISYRTYNPATDEYRVAFRDLNTNTVLFDVPCRNVDTFSFAGGFLYGLGGVPATNEAGIYEGEGKNIYLFDERGPSRKYQTLKTNNFISSPAFPYISANMDPEKDLIKQTPSDLAVIDLVQGGIYYPLLESGYVAESAAAWDPESPYLYQAVISEGKRTIAVINPSKLNSERILRFDNLSETEPKSLEEILTKYQSFSDRIGDAFGVSILLADSEKTIVPPAGYSFLNLDELPDLYVQHPIEVERMLSISLKNLQTLFEQYPDTFFQSFRKNGEGGIRFILIAELLNDQREQIDDNLISQSEGWTDIILPIFGPVSMDETEISVDFLKKEYLDQLSPET